MSLIPHTSDPDFTLYVGDVLDILHELPDESVHCCVTSPPYWGLRDYGCEGQLGLESTPEEFVVRMVGVFREVRRVLRSDGTCWLNIGDSYAGSWGAQSRGSTSQLADRSVSRHQIIAAPKRVNTGSWVNAREDIKPKDLVGIPWRLAFALQADGWYLRSDIIWSKPNPMPESVTDRPTKAHEYLFLLSRSPRYFYDADAIREPAEWARWGDQTTGPGSMAWIGAKPKAELRSGRVGRYQQRAQGGDGDGTTPRKLLDEPQCLRNKRSVWEIATESYPEAHFATFPQALVEPCIKAGCPEGGAVLDPFMGSGTTALVARRLGRRSVGIELNPEYAELAARRLSQLSLLAKEAA